MSIAPANIISPMTDVGYKAMTLGERIRNRRLAVGLTQMQLSKLSGIGQSALSSLEGGGSQWVRGHNLLRLAKALQTTPKWLETGEDAEEERYPMPDSSYEPIWHLLSDDNKHKLWVMAKALLQDQLDPKPSAAHPFPKAPRPSAPRKAAARRTKKATP